MAGSVALDPRERCALETEVSAMPSRDPVERECPSNAGLCARCAHLRLVGAAGRSVFVQCGRAKTEPAFARYPRLPVVACRGFEPEPGPESPQTDY
jgi:hypothetical protein